MENPSADSNHIINFSLKLDNFVMMNGLLNMLMAGGTTFGLKTVFGRGIEKYTTNYLGVKRGEWASIAIYVVSFFYI